MNGTIDPIISQTKSRPRLAIDVGGVISVVDTDSGISNRNLVESTCEALARTTPTLECAEAVALLVNHFGLENTFILSKCKRPTQLATIKFLWRSIDGGGSFFERTGLLPQNVLFCTRRSGYGRDTEEFTSIEMEDLVSDDGSATGARVAAGDVGKGAVARKFGLTHFIDDREECLLSEMLEGHLVQPHLNSHKHVTDSSSMSKEIIGGTLIQFADGRVPKRSEVYKKEAVYNFLDSHRIKLEQRENAVDDCLAKWTVATGWKDVLQVLGTHKLPPNMVGMRLKPKVPPAWDDLSLSQKCVYEKLVSTINQPIEIVDQQYNTIPDSFGGRVIGTDAARELSEEYRSGFEGCLLYSQVTSSPASTYAQDRFRREIEKAPPSGTNRRILVLTAGGPASGKTSVIRSDLVNGIFDLVMDQNLGKYARAIEQIELARANDWDVRIVYVFKPFDLVAAKVFDRANKHGRWAPASCFGQAHIAAQESILKLYDRYMADSKEPKVEVKLFENLHTKENPIPCAEISVEDIRPGGKYYLGDKKVLMEEIFQEALQAAKESVEPRLMAAMEFGTNPATGK